MVLQACSTTTSLSLRAMRMSCWIAPTSRTMTAQFPGSSAIFPAAAVVRCQRQFVNICSCCVKVTPLMSAAVVSQLRCSRLQEATITMI